VGRISHLYIFLFFQLLVSCPFSKTILGGSDPLHF
jgi:hypothetical protein